MICISMGDLEAKSDTFAERCEGYLESLEVPFVFLILVLIFLFLIGELAWILWSMNGAVRQCRLLEVICMLDSHWKICLVILVPLFFRPVRIFLLKLEGVGWLTTTKHRETEVTSNPERKKREPQL
jgi:hypothetical protein